MKFTLDDMQIRGMKHESKRVDIEKLKWRLCAGRKGSENAFRKNCNLLGRRLHYKVNHLVLEITNNRDNK